MTATKKNGFVYSGVSESQDENRSLIYGYRDLLVTSLDESVKYVASNVPCIEKYVNQAKQNCYKRNPELTLDESAAIYLYTMQTPFHVQLNNTLRAENRDELKLWLAFLKLFITALTKLPTLSSTIVWRGVASDLSSNFVDNPLQTWWTVNSCSMNPRVIEFYLGGMGTVFGIQMIHGKDISLYSAMPDEKEVVLMPGTRVQMMGQPFEDKNKPYIVSLRECTTIPQGKHVMLSYHPNNKNIISKIYQILQEAHIPVWFEERRDLEHNLRNSMADGVENAVIVCCFITPDYASSNNCQCELQYAQKRGRKLIPCLLGDTKREHFSDWLKRITASLKPIDFHDISDCYVHSKTEELIDEIKEQSWISQHLSLRPSGGPSYLFELIRQKYQRNSRIERIMNPSKSFPIDQSYINLAIVKAKDHQEKEKQLCDAQHSNTIIGAYEEIYGMKTVIDVKNIFDTCKNQEKQILVFGRAGIGKSIFSQYIAYQWATRSYWPQYELLALIPLRRLTSNRYPPGKTYSLIDLVKKEVFQCDLSKNDDILLKNLFDAEKTLWVLDGYDEIVQNVPSHLQSLLERLLKTPHHILTSRPYLNTLSYNVQMEITGFTDEDIEEYVQQFFDQMNDEIDNASIKSQSLFRFLKSNSSIWGVAHVPINLELICSCWSNEDWSDIKQITITTLYSMITEWLCRRYLRTQGDQILQFSKEDIEQHCHKELHFLESLAFNAMESNTIILRPPLLRSAVNEAKISSKEHPHILNIGVLKSFNKQGIGNRIEMNKDHYFTHLSFQEYFAARFLINILSESSNERAISFIKHQKYNQRYTLLFTFVSGLLSESYIESSQNIFWANILEEPIDLIGIRHIQLVVACIEETTDKSTIPQHLQLLKWIANCIENSIITQNEIICAYLSQSLRRAPSITSDQILRNVFINLLQHNDNIMKTTVLSFISRLNLSNPSPSVITSIIATLGDENESVRDNACAALGNIGDKTRVNEVITKLVNALGDKSERVRYSACEALGKIGEKAATHEVISTLVTAVGDKSEYVRMAACRTLGKVAEKAETHEVIIKLVSVVGDKSESVRRSVCDALWEIGQKVGTNEVISRLLTALGDDIEMVGPYACEALGKIGQKTETNEVISTLVTAVGDKSEYVRMGVCKALGKIGKKAATHEVISTLVTAVGDKSESVRRSACGALGNIGEKAATHEVISTLVTALGDKNEYVRMDAREALGKIGEKAATHEVISTLVTALVDKNEYVRMGACETFGKIGKKAETYEVISKLVDALGDKSESVRSSACGALENIGKKAVTDKVISTLVTAVKDKSESVRRSACGALGNIGEKTGTNEVISTLVTAVGDKSEYVRRSACEALGKIGKKTETNKVISTLVTAVGDKSEYVRASACGALGKIGEKTETNEVISTLVTAVGDKSESVRRSACGALENIGEKAATDEVISTLVTALGDEILDVRWSAREALGKIGKKTDTNKVISKLVTAVGDKSEYVRRNACGALEEIGEKAATDEVISTLVTALEDQSESVRWIACEALGKISEKAGTNVVISRLVKALGDESKNVRWSACEALGKIGKKTETNEVISTLVTAVGDKSEYVRRYACGALGNIGEKAATNEVISKLILLIKNDKNSYDAKSAINKILSSFAVAMQLAHNIISDVILTHYRSDCLKNVSEDQLIEFFLTTENSDWLPAVAHFAFLKGIALTALEGEVVVCGKKEPLEVKISDLQFHQQLVKALTNQRELLHLYIAIPLDTEEKIHYENAERKNDEGKIPHKKRRRKNRRTKKY